MHSPPHTCICIIWISQKKKQSFKSWKFWRTFCSKDFCPFTFNIPAFSLALCSFSGSSPMKTHNLNCCWRIDCEQLPLLSSYMRESHVIIWELFGSLSESGMVKNCLQVGHQHFILQHTFIYLSCSNWMAINEHRYSPKTAEEVLFAYAFLSYPACAKSTVLYFLGLWISILLFAMFWEF